MLRPYRLPQPYGIFEAPGCAAGDGIESLDGRSMLRPYAQMGCQRKCAFPMFMGAEEIFSRSMVPALTRVNPPVQQPQPGRFRKIRLRALAAAGFFLTARLL